MWGERLAELIIAREAAERPAVRTSPARGALAPAARLSGGDTEIILDCGITIRLDCLFQYGAYSGHFTGWPTRQTNAELIARALQEAAEKLRTGGAPHLLPPKQIPLGAPREVWMTPDDESAPCQIPPVASLATFESLTPARDPNADCSSLNVVWFQNSFGPPGDAELLRQFRAIDWRSLAQDGYW